MRPAATFPSLHRGSRTASSRACQGTISGVPYLAVTMGTARAALYMCAALTSSSEEPYNVPAMAARALRLALMGACHAHARALCPGVVVGDRRFVDRSVDVHRAACCTYAGGDRYLLHYLLYIHTFLYLLLYCPFAMPAFCLFAFLPFCQFLPSMVSTGAVQVLSFIGGRRAAAALPTTAALPHLRAPACHLPPHARRALRWPWPDFISFLHAEGTRTARAAAPAEGWYTTARARARRAHVDQGAANLCWLPAR